MEFFNIIIESLAHTFLHVGALVAIVLLLFNLLNFILRGKLVSFIESRGKFQPILGALLGLTPGCGGVIILLPLYMRKSVSFGTILASFIATMGDSAFLLIATKPFNYLQIIIISFIVAIIVGYTVDGLKLDQKLKLRHANHNTFTNISHLDCEIDISHEEHKKQVNKKFVEKLYNIYLKYVYYIYWVIVAIGFTIGLDFFISAGGHTVEHEHNYPIVGVIGTTLSILILLTRYLVKDKHHHCNCELTNVKSIFSHTAEDAAFVISFIFLASLLYSSIAHIIGPETLEVKLLSINGITIIIIGALVGLIPGCGPQIIFATLYLQGTIPFAALLANAISQDGDALFPFLALNKKAALYSVLIKFIPGLIVGLAYHYLTMFF